MRNFKSSSPPTTSASKVLVELFALLVIITPLMTALFIESRVKDLHEVHMKVTQEIEDNLDSLNREYETLRRDYYHFKAREIIE